MFVQQLIGESTGQESPPQRSLRTMLDVSSASCEIKRPAAGSSTSLSDACLAGRFQNPQVGHCFLRLAESCFDGMTKNVPDKLFEEHAEVLVNVAMLEGKHQEGN
jgi:hypothetical protein